MPGQHRLGRTVIDKVTGQLAASFPVNHIATQVLEALERVPAWTELQQRLTVAGIRAKLFWNDIDLPEIPTLDDVCCYARGRLSRTPSLDATALRARERSLELVYSRLYEAVASPAAG